MRTLTAAILVAAALVAGIIALRLQERAPTASSGALALTSSCAQAALAFSQHRSGPFITMSGRVTRILHDLPGTRLHQRFVVACASGQTLLIVNDVSIGQRVPVRLGDRVAVRGQFVWNSEGGLIHFTHRDDAGGVGGWIYDRGKVYS